MRRDRASTLLVFPAVLLVMVVLASIVVDFARLRLAQRQADDLAAARANDAVTVGLDVDALRRGEDYRLDPARIDGRLTGPRSVEVVVTRRVPLGFARILPGAPDVVVVRASATATAALR
jgi:hypothetical protein